METFSDNKTQEKKNNSKHPVIHLIVVEWNTWTLLSVVIESVDMLRDLQTTQWDHKILRGIAQRVARDGIGLLLDNLKSVDDFLAPQYQTDYCKCVVGIEGERKKLFSDINIPTKVNRNINHFCKVYHQRNEARTHIGKHRIVSGIYVCPKFTKRSIFCIKRSK